jgi:tetratricopeptide (TPR) repeat protein
MRHRTELLLVCGVLILFAQSSRSGTDQPAVLRQAKHLLREGNVLNDPALVQEGRKLLASLYADFPSADVLYFVAQAEYELVRLGVADRKNKLYERYIDSAMDKAEAVLEQRGEWSEAYALISLLEGYRIAYNPVNAVTAGPKSFFAAEEAVKLDSTNPRAWLARGIVRLHMPGIFGGSTTEAIKSFKNALALFDQHPVGEANEPNWGRLDAELWLGWAYHELGQTAEAVATYSKALSREPRADWIRELFLLPLEEEME